MGISLKQVGHAVDLLGLNKTHIECAINELRCLLTELNDVPVKGRDQVDTMLGCMLAIDAIIGKEEDNG